MAQSVIQIKRSLGNAAPGQLRPGEFAYSSAETGATGTTAGVLYIGGPSANSQGFATTNYVIGGTKYTSLLDVEAGKLTAGKAIVVDKDGGVDTIHGVKNTDTGETKLVIGLPDNDNQKVVIHDPYVKNKSGEIIKLDQFIDQFVKDGVITLVAGDGIADITNQNGTYTIALEPTGAQAGTYGSETKVPSFTINQYGQITNIEEKTISTKMNVEDATGDVAGNVDLISGKLTIEDGLKLDVATLGTFATTNYVIGGTKYTSLLDVEAGKLTAGKAIVVDKDGGVDTIHGVKNTDTGETKLVIGLPDDDNQKVVIHDPYVKNKSGEIIKLDQFIDQFVKDGVITLVAGDGIANITNQNGTYTIALKPTGANVGKYGSETKVPSFTINQYGQITEISEKTISTAMNVEDSTGDNAGTVDLINGKIVFGDGIKLDTQTSGTIKAEVDETVVRTSGAQSIAGVKTMSDMPVITADQGDIKTGNANEVAKLGTVKAQTVYTDTTENGTTVALGGIPKGTKYTDADVTKILHELLHPYVAPTGVSLTLNENGGVFEKGVTKHITSGTVRWTNGSTRVEKAEILVEGVAKGTQTVTGVKNSQSVTITEAIDVKDNTNFTARITEDSKQQTISGGASITEAAIKGLQKDVSIKGTKSYTYDTAKIEKQVVIAYPASYGDLKSILDPNKFENIDKFKGAKSTVSITGLDNTPQQYIVYAPKTNVENMKFTFSF